jgi:hypothetical protein
MAFLTQNTASFCKKLIIIFFSRITPIVFAETWAKSLKIVIIISAPDRWNLATLILFQSKFLLYKIGPGFKMHSVLQRATKATTSKQ